MRAVPVLYEPFAELLVLFLQLSQLLLVENLLLFLLLDYVPDHLLLELLQLAYLSTRISPQLVMVLSYHLQGLVYLGDQHLGLPLPMLPDLLQRALPLIEDLLHLLATAL